MSDTSDQAVKGSEERPPPARTKRPANNNAKPRKAATAVAAGVVAEALAQMTNQIEKAIEQAVKQTQPAQTTAGGSEEQAASFGYRFIGGLLSRPGKDFAVIVDATRDKDKVTFPDLRGLGLLGGTHADLHCVDKSEVLEITDTGTVSPVHIKSGEPIDSILILAGKSGPIVAIGPRLRAITPKPSKR